MRDETMSSVASHSVHTDYEFYRHDKTVNVNGIGEILSEWKQIVREHKNTQGMFIIQYYFSVGCVFKILFFRTANDYRKFEQS